MSIPQEVEQNIKDCAHAAAVAFRQELGADNSKSAFMVVFEKVLQPSMNSLFVDIGRAEFKKHGRAHVREVVLKVFDNFIEQGKL